MPIELGKTLLAVIGFAPFLLAPGYLFCLATDIASFRRRGWPQRLLWSLSLSCPLTLCMLALVEYVVPVHWAALGGLLAGAIAATVAVVRCLRHRPSLSRPQGYGLLLVAALAAYIVAATIPVQSGSRLYESVAAGDWSVRIPLVNMAIHHAEPLINPFDGIDAKTWPLNYYFYWYLLCGAVGALFNLPAAAVLPASDVWAAMLLLAALFLLFRFLFRPTGLNSKQFAWLCLLCVPVGCIIGLDIVGIAKHLFDHPVVLVAELDWWRADSDFSLSFHTAILYAPHHCAGLAAALVGFVLLLPPRLTGIAPNGAVETRLQAAARIFAAGLCAAMIVGCSTYISVFLLLASVFTAVDRIANRDYLTVRNMAIAGMLAVLISVPFLRGLALHASHGSDKTAHTSPLRLHLRSSELTHRFQTSLEASLHLHPSGPVRALARTLWWPGYAFLEMGFFTFVLYVRARDDWHRRGSLTFAERAQWELFFGIALPALFLSSDSLSGSNDLGRHAGLALRVVAVLWATPLVSTWLHTPAFRARFNSSWWGRLALATVALGLTSQVYQAFSQRFHLYLADRHLIGASRMPFPELADPGLYYFDLYHGYLSLNDAKLPPGRVLYNPTSKLNSALMLNQTRDSVAPEPNCMTAFGGDISECKSAMPKLQQLFGGIDYYYIYPKMHEPFILDAMTLQALAEECRQHGAAFAVVSDQDPVWRDRGSFAWHAIPIFTTPRVRFLRCPQ